MGGRGLNQLNESARYMKSVWSTDPGWSVRQCVTLHSVMVDPDFRALLPKQRLDLLH
jgi:hypothetical protein